MSSSAAVNYLVPPPQFIWGWEEDFSAVRWQEGNTITVWPELHALINHLVPYGLPPLGSILMLLMACQGRAEEALDSAVYYSSQTTGGTEPSGPSRRLLKQTQNLLERVQDLPEELRTGLPARAHLLVRLFEDVQNRLPVEHSQMVLAQMDVYGLEHLNKSQPSLGGSTRLLRDLKALATVASMRNLGQLETFLRAGLESVTVAPAHVPPPKPVPGDTALPLLQQLEEYPQAELGIIAGTARRMVAMFTVPRPTGHPQELPVGGISDITNRGTLDHLIPSELAYDDLTLTARLANNEALFFRRDTPPDEPATERIILLDSGLHMWGTPRVFALAAALGLQSQAAASEAVTVFRREGRRFQSLKLDSVEAVKHYLYELPPDPDPAEALAGFHLDESSPCRPDVFFVSVAQRAGTVMRALHGMALEIAAAGGHFYLLTLSRSGAMELALRNPSGTRVIAMGRIDPDTLFAPDAPVEKAPRQTGTQALYNGPELIRSLAYYQQYPLPFRFPAQQLAYDLGLDLPGSRLGITMDGRLMRWDGAQRGAVELYAGIHEARNLTIMRHGNEIVVVGSAIMVGGKVRAVVVDEATGAGRDLILASSHSFPSSVKLLSGAVVLEYAHKAEACSLDDGRFLDTVGFTENHRFNAVTFDGRKLGLRSTNEPALGQPRVTRAPRPVLPAMMAVPILCGFSARGMVIRTNSSSYVLTIPDLKFCEASGVVLEHIRPFVQINSDRTPSPTAPKFYQAQWNADCRLIYDTRGVLHFVFRDKPASVELSLLALLEEPSAVWVRDWPQHYAGSVEWINYPGLSQDANDTVQAVPLFMRFTAAASGSTAAV